MDINTFTIMDMAYMNRNFEGGQTLRIIYVW